MIDNGWAMEYHDRTFTMYAIVKLVEMETPKRSCNRLVRAFSSCSEINQAAQKIFFVCVFFKRVIILTSSVLQSPNTAKIIYKN